MRLDDHFRKTVVFVGYLIKEDGEGDERFVPAGTAFLVSTETLQVRFDHVVTCRHNIEAIANELRELGVRDEDARVILRVNKIGGGADYVETKLDDWKFHPDSTHYVDVAVVLVRGLPTSVGGHELDVTNFGQSSLVTDDVITDLSIRCGAPTTTVGLFTSHFGETHNVPIVRSGMTCH